jgi:hypothetical protein
MHEDNHSSRRDDGKSPAISRALADFLRMRERQAFIDRALAGQTDYALTNEELEARDAYPHRLGCPLSRRPLQRRAKSGW